LAPDALSDIMFTSGTTGAPKGVMTTHAQNVRVYAEWARIMTLRAGDRYVVIYPFFHCGGYKAGMLSGPYAGTAPYPQATYDNAGLAALVPAEKINVLPAPPTVYQSLLALAPESRGDFSSLRVANVGATTVPPSVVQRMRSELGMRTVVTGYGLTETC